MHALIDAVGDAIICVDREVRFVLWNPGAVRLFGFSSDEALGESPDLIIPPESREAHWEGFHKAMRLNQTRFPCALTVGAVKGKVDRIENIGVIIREESDHLDDQQ